MKPHYLQTDCKHNFQTTLTANISRLKYSISSAGLQVPLKWRLVGGREVGHGLNWAGLELTPDRQLFMYSVIFRETHV
jgi:hypothetical protein